MILADDPVPYDPRIFLRGNPNRVGDNVPRRFLDVLNASKRPFSNGSGRLELARSIARRDNPLTARVFVNRVWMHHFGAGLVRTPGDFGVRSEPPSHPELLDHLAARFMDEGWSIKKLHQSIMLSAVYQQASFSPPNKEGLGGSAPEGSSNTNSRHQGADAPRSPETLDPENRLLWRMNRRRLDFEGLRDSLLFAAGSLDRQIGGPPVNLLAGTPRRAVYGFIDRLALPGLLRTFDFPSPDTTSPLRDTTTVAPQALYLMNSPFALDCAQKLARRSESPGDKDFLRRVTRLHQLALSRVPTPDELRLAEEFFGSEPAARESAVTWERYAQALLLSNEFAFVD
jgi:hypothetical protein